MADEGLYPARPPRTQRRPRRRALSRLGPTAAVTAAVIGCGLAAGIAAPVSAGSTHSPPPSALATPAPGQWVQLSTSTALVEAGTPTVWLGPDNRAWIVWMQQVATNKFTYSVAIAAPSGGIAVASKNTFGSSPWPSLSGEPTLLGHGSEPVLVFSGIGLGKVYSKGCIVGALPSSTNWLLQTWSLSNGCVNPVGSAAEGKNGVLAAAWPGGWPTGHGVLYHVGVSPSIPAASPDGRLSVTTKDADVYKAGVAGDVAGNGNFYAAMVQEFSSPGSADGIYLKDVTTGTANEKAPGSGTLTVNEISEFGDLAFVNTNSHAGVWLAYCSNTTPCHLDLWRYGSKTPVVVPGSTSASNVAVSAGPDGRLWLAFYNESTNVVAVVRTNKADTAFGRVTTFSTPCFEHGLIGLSSGVWGRLDIALQCVRTSDFKVEDYTTQAIASLAVSPTSATIYNTAAHQVTFKVTDVGDPVAGATVTVDGQHGLTGAAGNVTFSFAKGTAPGTFKVTAGLSNYNGASSSLTVKK